LPIANCYINQVKVSDEELEALTNEWAEKIEVELKDICLSFVEVSTQTGQKYKVLVNLFLPSAWDKSSIEKIQINLDLVLKKYLRLNDRDVFIITNIVESGNVVEGGKIVRWS